MLFRSQELPDDYVVATGIGATVREFADAAFSYAGMDYTEFVEFDARYKRPMEVNALIGDASKAEEKLNWKAKTNWRELAKMMVDADLELSTY